MPSLPAPALVPHESDLPGPGWLSVDDALNDSGGNGGPAELFDCVGPAFPDREVTETASSPYFLRPRRTLVHGIGVAFSDAGAASRAQDILSAADFAECLARAVAADLDQQPIDSELLAVDLSTTAVGQRVRFTGGDVSGIQAVHLDIVSIRIGSGVALLWFGDTPDPFPPADRDHILGRLRRRSEDPSETG